MSLARKLGRSLARLFFIKNPRRTGRWALGQRRTRRPPAQRPLIFEALEPRLLLSGTPVTVMAPVELIKPSGQPAVVEGAQVPPGSLIAGSTVHEDFQAAGEVDTYTLSADAGQTLTLELHPQGAAVKGKIEVLEQGGALLGSVEAGTVGGFVILENVSLAQAGTYSLKFSSLEGTGNYDLKAWLNTAREAEPFGGPTNNDLASAIDLGPSAIMLQGQAERLALLGQTEPTTPDFYRFDLTAGQTATIAATSLDGSATLSVDLRNATNTVLATGLADATNVEQYVRNFTAPASGTYYVRVGSAANHAYSLMVTKSADIELEPNASVVMAEDISLTGQVLGSVGQWMNQPEGTVKVAVVSTVTNDSGINQIISQLNDSTVFSFNASLVSASQVDSVAELNAYDVVIIGNNGSTGGDQFDQIAPALRQWVEAGGGVVAAGWTVLGAGVGTGSDTPMPDIDAIISVNTSGSYASGAGSVDIASTTHPVTAGLSSFTIGGGGATEFPFTSPYVDPGATLLATISNLPIAAAGTPGLGRSVYLGPLYASGYADTGLRTGGADQLLEQAVAWAGARDRQDQYLVRGIDGATLTIFTATPSGL